MDRRARYRHLLPFGLALIVSTVVSAPATAAVERAETAEGSAAPAAGLAATQIVPGSVNHTTINLTATYAVTLSLRYGTRAFNVNSTATIVNTSGVAIDRVELDLVPARLGHIALRTVEVDGRGVARHIDDQTVIVGLGGILPPGASVKVRVQYTSTLRSTVGGSDWMFTRANGIVDAYRWIPWVSRATPFDRPNNGDPFQTPVSPLVALKVQTDRPLRLVTSGRRTFVSADGLTQRFEARNVRDVTLTAAPDFHSISTLIGTTRVRYSYRSSANRATILDAAADALRALQSRLGPYPYTTFDVVQSAGGYGMESPALIWIPYGVSSANLRYLVSHETAHQWFYSLVGNDQANQPFVDEAMADFLARDITRTRRASRCSTSTLDRSIYQYSGSCYYEVIYIQGGNLIDTVRSKMGATRFWSTLRTFVADNRDRLVRTPSLLRALDDATPVDLSILFRPRFPRFY
jgi:hypothetical protein